MRETNPAMKMMMATRTQAVATAAAALVLLTLAGRGPSQTIETRMPAADEPHEGTWLQWPHHYTYGLDYRNQVEAQWVEMTRALVTGENVHIIAYDAAERERIVALLGAAGVPLERVDFLIRRTDDYWVRDNGPIFVFDIDGNPKLTDWGFDGWGDDASWGNDNTVPAAVAGTLGMPLVDLNAMVLEGGAIEVDGRGVLMATRSSILEPKRNAGLTQTQAEAYMRQHLGIRKFIWLDGADGGTEDITDTHIDGFAVFGPGRTIVTMSREDLAYWQISAADIDRLYAATDIDGVAYEFVHLPLTTRDVVTTYGQSVGYRSSYANYYVGNSVVLMPSYSDPSDAVAKAVLEGLYPDRTVVPIDCRNLCVNGGMVHCVTQQQPSVPVREPAPMGLSMLRADAAGVVMTFQGEAGASYRLEACPNLLSGGWAEVESFVLAGTTRTLTVPMGSEARRFFRVVRR